MTLSSKWWWATGKQRRRIGKRQRSDFSFGMAMFMLIGVSVECQQTQYEADFSVQWYCLVCWCGCIVYFELRFPQISDVVTPYSSWPCSSISGNNKISVIHTIISKCNTCFLVLNTPLKHIDKYGQYSDLVSLLFMVY